MAHRAALGCSAVARQLSVVVMVVSIIALVAATAGTSYAKKPKPPKEDSVTEDTVVVSNFGSLFAGSVETFTAGSILTSGPLRLIRGPNTLLGAGNGASGDGQSSADGDIAVTVPFGVPGLCPAGCVFVWPAGANGNLLPEEILGGPAGPLDPITKDPVPFEFLNNNTGLFLDQGVAFEDPFEDFPTDVHNASATLGLAVPEDNFAVSNFGQIVIASFDPESTTPSCLGATFEQPPPTVGTITFFKSEQTGNVAPTPNVPVVELTFALKGPVFSNATIGGCDTALAGPLGLAFDKFNHLWVVNELGKFVTEYAEDAAGDAHPIKIIGAPLTPTAGTLIDPGYIAVSPAGDTIYVTDVGDNSIKIFGTGPTFGILLSTIAGGHTKLVRPEGIALGAEGALYVVNNNANSLSMFDDFDPAVGGNIAPKVIVKGKASKMNFPVGVALPQFSPPAL